MGNKNICHPGRKSLSPIGMKDGLIWSWSFDNKTSEPRRPQKTSLRNLRAWVHAEHGLPKILLYVIQPTLYIPPNHNLFPTYIKPYIKNSNSWTSKCICCRRKTYVEKPKWEKWLKKFNFCRIFHTCTSSVFRFWTNPSPHQLVTPW